MKISYIADGQTIILGDDDAGKVIAPFLPRHSRNVQPVQYFRAPTTRYIQRSNAQNQRAFTVDLQHDDESAALIFLRDHPDSLASSGVLQVDQNGTSQFFDAALQAVDCIRHDGRSTVWSYTFACSPGKTSL